MATRAETTRKPQSGWGRANRIAQSSMLAISIVAGASALTAEPLEADAPRTKPSTPITVERTTSDSAASQGLASPQMSVSAFSAAQSNAARVLLAQELSGESNRAVGTVAFPAGPPVNSTTTRVGEAQARQQEADEAATADAEESLIVGRSLRAFTRSEEESDASAPRRRASFSSAISRAAAAGALTTTNPNASISNALSPARFQPAGNAGQFDPGFSDAAEVLSVVPGLRLESATIFGGYSSNSVPRGFGSGSYAFRNLGADYDLGASAVLTYSRQGRRSLTQFTYTPSHVQRSRIPEWSTTDHRLSFQTSRDLTPRLSWRAMGTAGNTGMEQYWTRPVVVRRVDVPASFSELMSKVLSGEISDDEFAAILTGSPVVDDPGGAMRELDRVFSASLGTGASYAYSRRLTFNVSANSALNRMLRGDFHRFGDTAPYLRYARTTRGVFSADYRMSSRTTVGFTHATTLADSSFVKSVSHNPSVSLQQALSRHWRYQIGAGIGMIQFDPDRSRTGITDATTWTGHALLAYATGPHQITLSGGKQVGDPLGFGSRSTIQGNLTWTWQPRFSPWGANAGIGYSRSDFSRLTQYGGELASDIYSAGMSRRLTASTTFRSDYFYGEFLSPYTGIASNMSLHRLQMSLVWRPVEAR